MLEREEWMNTEKFINYENKLFESEIESYIESEEIEKTEKEWNKYNENKIRGNGICPLCRSKPCDWWTYCIH